MESAVTDKTGAATNSGEDGPAKVANNNKHGGHGHHHSHGRQNGKLTTGAAKEKEPADGERRKPIRLQSPAGAAAVSWSWSASKELGIEVLDFIRLTFNHYPELEGPLKGRIENIDVSNYDQVRSLAKKFNKILGQSKNEKPSKVRPKELLHQIVTRCYNRAVDNEKALNKHYEAFSSQTYGETSYERMQMIIDELKPTDKDVFVDLGSGVGQLVVQMAGGSNVHKAVGIEIAKLPADFARKLESEFKKWMGWFGRPVRPFELRHGDFLNDEFKRLITEEATIIFINNFAFQSDLETRIKRELLSDLKEGTRIISTKPYVPLNKQGAITDRQLSDISVIIDVVEMKPCPNPCSWTSAYVPYYLHTINRKKLEMYFTQRNSSLRCKSTDTGGSRRSSTPNSNGANSRDSSVGCVRDGNGGRVNGGAGDEICFGPTTRRKWHEYVNDLEQQKKRKNGDGGAVRGGGRRSSSTSTSCSNTPAPAAVAAPVVTTPSATTSSSSAPFLITTINNIPQISSNLSTSSISTLIPHPLPPCSSEPNTANVVGPK